MLSHLLALAVFLQPVAALRQQDPPYKPRSIYDTVFTKTTGTNGYEEYVKACDLLMQEPLKQRFEAAYLSAEGVVAPYLQSRRELVISGAKVLELVRQGNRKTVHDPREAINSITLFPELAQFRKIVRVFTAESYVRYADGNPLGGMNSLFDALTFSSNISQRTLLSAMASYGALASVLYQANERLPMMSEAEAQAVIAFTDKLLALPNPVLLAVEGEGEVVKASLRVLFNNPHEDEYALYTLGKHPEGGTELLEKIEALTPQAKTDILSSLTQRVDAGFALLVKQLSLRLPGWEKAVKNYEDGPFPTTLEDRLFELVKPSYFHRQAMMIGGLRYAKLSLFRLHAAIIRFRWHNNRLPRKLSELEAPEYAKDPLTAEDMVYELTGDSYELYSKGFKSTGPIYMRYQPMPEPQDSPVDPPVSARR